MPPDHLAQRVDLFFELERTCQVKWSNGIFQKLNLKLTNKLLIKIKNNKAL